LAFPARQSGGANVRNWHFCDIPRQVKDGRFSRQSGSSGLRGRKSDFDPKPTFSVCGIVVADHVHSDKAPNVKHILIEPGKVTVVQLGEYGRRGLHAASFRTAWTQSGSRALRDKPASSRRLCVSLITSNIADHAECRPPELSDLAPPDEANGRGI